MSQIIFLIDPLEKLNIKKDSSLLMALTAKGVGHSVFLLFASDLYYQNKKLGEIKVYDFTGTIGEDCYLKDFKLNQPLSIVLRPKDQLHMRLDPPIDGRYLRTLWILQELQEQGVEVSNNPTGILNYNEKLLAYRSKLSLPSYVGSSIPAATKWLAENKVEEGIIKPMDLFQGMGVERFHSKKIDDQFFQDKLREYGGAFILQPYQAAIAEGEIRSIYWRGKHLGSILKKPKTGEFLANVAQGASFQSVELNSKLKAELDMMAQDLFENGIDLIAYDVIGEAINEVNLTCPGLLVEVSHAHKRNLAKDLFS